MSLKLIIINYNTQLDDNSSKCLIKYSNKWVACPGSSWGKRDRPHAIPSVLGVILLCSFQGDEIISFNNPTILVNNESSVDGHFSNIKLTADDYSNGKNMQMNNLLYVCEYKNYEIN